MKANQYVDYSAWDFFIGEIHKDCPNMKYGMSIMVNRRELLMELNLTSEAIFGQNIRVAGRDAKNDIWTKWMNYWGSDLDMVFDVHRSILPCEIVIEADYVCDACKEEKKNEVCGDCYELNYEASRLNGQIIERKGFTPHYWYSGSKSIHIHVFFDVRCFNDIDSFLQKDIMEKFRSKNMFLKKFIEWLRERMVSCWGTKVREFDENLIKSSHLIRSELSLNKFGYKTFLGYTYKDLSFIPYVCSTSTKIYPQSCPEIVFSRPESPQELVEDFLMWLDRDDRKKRLVRKENSLHKWIHGDNKDVSNIVKFILSDKFKAAGDGYKRAMFILANELVPLHGKEKTEKLIIDWSNAMDADIRLQEIEYRVRYHTTYSLSRSYLYDFVKRLGLAKELDEFERNI